LELQASEDVAEAIPEGLGTFLVEKAQIAVDTTGH
jgi:hypothetical protein